MNKQYPFQVGFARLSRFAVLFLCCTTLVLASCATKDSPSSSGHAKSKTPVSPMEKRLAYDVTVNMPDSYNIVSMLTPDAVSKDNLTSRIQSGERVPLLEAIGRPSSKEVYPGIMILLVNPDGVFMPLETVNKIKPEEFPAISREILAHEQAESKKRKQKTKLLELQVTRDMINGNVAIVNRMLAANTEGQTARLIHWDIYLANGTGLHVRGFFDPDQPGAENEIAGIVRSLQIQ